MKPEPRQDIAIRLSSAVLALLACAVMELARTSANGFNTASMSITAFILIVVLAIRWRRGTSNPRTAKMSIAAMTALLCLVVLPSVAEWASQAWFGLGQAHEFHLCAWIRNLMVATLAVAS